MGILPSFLEKIAEINNLDITGPDKKHGEWIFHHGMLFSSPYKWWQDSNSLEPAKRETLHEGLDILFFKDKNKQIQKLNTDTLIPAATNGKIVNICDDFIGQSIIVQHSISFQQKLDLIIIYAHILPDNKIKIGRKLNQGEIIASIAGRGEEKTIMPPHLHFSTLEILKKTRLEHLNWDFFSNRKSKINLINPIFI
jgi:hypothetical protein